MLTFKEKLNQIKSKYLDPKYDEKTREQMIDAITISMLDWCTKYPNKEIVKKIITILQSKEFNDAACAAASKKIDCKANEDPFVRFAADYVMEHYK